MWPRRRSGNPNTRPDTPEALSLPGSAAPAKTPPYAKQVFGEPKRSRIGGDILLGLFGVSLGLGAAFFPWYVFLNQDQFGIKAVQFDNNVPAVAGLTSSTPQILRNAGPLEIRDLAMEELDQFSTGATASASETGNEAPSLDEQPFPKEKIPFELVHVANGRAMIEDASGLWVVERGSVLPDMSHVSSIERRDGAWVLITDGGDVIDMAR